MDFQKEKKKNPFKIYLFILKTTDIPRKSLKKKKSASNNDKTPSAILNWFPTLLQVTVGEQSCCRVVGAPPHTQPGAAKGQHVTHFCRNGSEACKEGKYWETVNMRAEKQTLMF